MSDAWASTYISTSLSSRLLMPDCFVLGSNDLMNLVAMKISQVILELA